MRAASSGASLSVVTVRSAGRTIGRVTVPFLVRSKSTAAFPPTRVTARVPLTPAGKRLARSHRRLRVKVTSVTRDLAGNTRTSTVSALLKR